MGERWQEAGAAGQLSRLPSLEAVKVRLCPRCALPKAQGCYLKEGSGPAQLPLPHPCQVEDQGSVMEQECNGVSTSPVETREPTHREQMESCSVRSWLGIPRSLRMLGGVY